MTRAILPALPLLVVGFTLAGSARAQPANERAAANQLQVHSIAWLVDHKREWSGWASIKRRLVVEGRYSFVTGQKLRMQECPLDFVPEKGAMLRQPVSRSKTVEVDGHVESRDGTPVFVVETMVSRASDAATFRSRETALSRTKPEEWHELAEWAETRADFYDDDELRASAREARAEGLRVEFAALDETDVDGLLALADRVDDLKHSPRLSAQYRHRAWRLQWESLRDREESPTAKELSAFAKRVAEAFDGTDKAPKADPSHARLLKAYSTRPVPTYDEANDGERTRLHRAFHADVVLRELQLGVDEAARNEEEVAARIERLVPEHRDVAARLRERALAREVSRVPSMTQAEMAALADRFRKAGNPARAGKVVDDWLAAKEERLRGEGAEGLIEAADFYESLTGDDDKVAALLIEAHADRPDSKPLADRLERLGYRFVEGRWTTEAPDRPADPIRDRGIGVTVGMTPDEVTEVLGTPRGVTRVASSGELTEVWIYGPRRSAGFAIHFVRRPAVETDVGHVVKVISRRPR